MRITVGERGEIIAEQVYNALTLRTAEGNEYAVAMRDDTIELWVAPGAPPPRVFFAEEEGVHVNPLLYPKKKQEE